MQDDVDNECSHFDISNLSNNSYDSSIDVDFDNSQHYHEITNSQEDVRIRGGCGEGGSGCCCSSGSRRVTLDNSNCCKRKHQQDRSSTIEGACGFSEREKGGCGENSGGCCNQGPEASFQHSPRIGGCCDEANEGACASKTGVYPASHGTCPPRSPDPCSMDPTNISPCNTGACSTPCSGRKGCCPPAGCRPVRCKTTRCASPCSSDAKGCGGGGCCGSGCRGGCGKPGQICLPKRPCTIPPCLPHPRGGSPCQPPRGCLPQPPCCRTSVNVGPASNVGDGSSNCCRTGSPGDCSAGSGGCSRCPRQQDDIIIVSCPIKLPTGCECLGGGQDCQRCGRKVYQAEMQIVSGMPYHNICFSCFCCRKPLETLTYHENCGEIYCKQCYVRNFGPQGYGYSGVLQTPM